MSDRERDDLASKSVKKAFHKIIQGTQLDSEWDKIVSEKKSGEGLLKNIGNGVLAHPSVKGRVSKSRYITAGFGVEANTFQVDRIFDVPHSPFRMRQAVETPQNRLELYNRFRYYFRYEPLVRTAIELHTEFPLSTFELSHEDSGLREEFNDMAESINGGTGLFDFILDMSIEYWLMGEAFPFGIFNNPQKPEYWTSFTLLNPADVEVMQVPITDGRSNTSLRLNLNSIIREIVRNGPAHKETGELFNRIPEDFKHAVSKGNGTIALPQPQASFFKRKGNYFNPRGESLLYSIIHLLSYRDKLRDANYYSADRVCTPREIYKLGETQSPATEDELQAFSDMLSATYLDPSAAIIWSHALQVETLGGADRIPLVSAEITKAEDEMLIGLMLNKGFLDSSYGAYASTSVSLDVLISRYLIFRSRMEDWIKHHFFEPICRLHNIYKPTKAELDHRIRIKNSNKRPWLPDVRWSKNELRDINQKMQLALQIRDKLGYPREKIWEMMGENPRLMKEQLAQERREVAREGPLPGAAPQGPGGPGGGMGGMGDMGGGPAGGIGAGGGGPLDIDVGSVPGQGATPPGGSPQAIDINAPAGPAGNESMNTQVTTGSPGVGM